LISLQTPRNTRSSSVVTLARPPTHSLKITSRSFRYMHHLTSRINFLTDFASHVLICLFLIYLFSKIISPHMCHPHHSYHQSHYHSSIPNSKLSYFSNLTIHRHLAPLLTDFTDTWTALRLFFSVSVFSSFQLSSFPSVLVFLSQVSYLSHNRLFLDFYFFLLFQFHFKHF